jgi:lysozyme
MLDPRMEYTSIGVCFTERHEGYRDRAYQDSGGVWTCGYGHTSGVGPSTTCTPELAAQWLTEDTQFAVNAVNNLVEVGLTQPEFNALVDFTYNIGVGAFQKSTLLLYLNQGDYVNAAAQFERWSYCNGVKVPGLFNRRVDEETLFNTPDNGGNDGT